MNSSKSNKISMHLDNFIKLIKVSNKKYGFSLYIIVAIAIIGLLIFVPDFSSINNLTNIIVQTSATGILAIGLTFVLITGGMDLSLAPVMAASAIIGSTFMVNGGNAFVGCLIMLLVAMIFGALNGFAVAKLGMIPFVVTLSTNVVAGGVALWYTKAESVYGLPESYTNLIAGNIGPIPVPVILLVICAIVSHILLSKTIYGRWVYALGTNSKTARISGIPTTKVLFSVYVLSGFFAGIAAILLTARLDSASAGMGSDTLVTDVISSAVIGGVSIYGGSGTIVGAIIGAVLITVISNSMNLIGVTYYTTLIVKGLVIVIATARDAFKSR